MIKYDHFVVYPGSELPIVIQCCPEQEGAPVMCQSGPKSLFRIPGTGLAPNWNYRGRVLSNYFTYPRILIPGRGVKMMQLIDNYNK